MPLNPINEAQTHMLDLYEQFSPVASSTGWTVFGASFLISAALLVIAYAALTTSFAPDGANVIYDNLLPLILPASFALIVSVPLISHAVSLAEQKNELYGTLVDSFDKILQSEPVLDHEDGATLIRSFLPEDVHKEFCRKIFSDLQKRLPEEKDSRSPDQQRAHYILTEASKAIYKSHKSVAADKKVLLRKLEITEFPQDPPKLRILVADYLISQ